MDETLLVVLIVVGSIIGLVVIASALDRNSKKHGNLFTTPPSPTMRILAIFLGLLFAGMFVLEVFSFKYIHVFPPILSVAMFAYAIGFDKLLVGIQNFGKLRRDNESPKYQKRSGEYPTESKWSIIQGQQNGKPIFVRRNDSAKQILSNQEFIYRIGFTIPLLKPNDVGLPSNEEMDSLNQIEDELTGQFEKEKNSIHVLAITTDGMREFVYYTKDTKIVEKIINDVRSKFPSHEIQYYIEEDRKWSVYKQFA
jgi:hypothetical protein